MTKHNHPSDITITATDAQGNVTTAHAEYLPDSRRTNPAEEVLLHANKSAGDELIRIIDPSK